MDSVHSTFPAKPSSEWKICLLFKLLILIRESECKEADFPPSILPSIQTVLKHTLQFWHKSGTITIQSLQSILPFTAVPHAHLSLGWKKEKGRILCTVSQLRHQVEREHLLLSVWPSLGGCEMWREHCFGTLSQFGGPVKSLFVEHCIQAPGQGEQVTHLPSWEEAPLFVDTCHEYVYLSIRFRCQYISQVVFRRGTTWALKSIWFAVINLQLLVKGVTQNRCGTYN